MTETVQMPIDSVRKHATSVDNVSAHVETGRSAANQVHLGSDAYGQLCQFLPALLEPVSQATVDALTNSVTALTETATSLRTAATRSELTDNSNAQRVDGTRHSINLPI